MWERTQLIIDGLVYLLVPESGTCGRRPVRRGDPAPPEQDRLCALQTTDSKPDDARFHQDRGQPTPSLLTLQPGDRAHSPLFWISTTDAAPCFTASALLVTPPDETEPLRAPFTHTVCGNGIIGQGAYGPAAA